MLEGKAQPGRQLHGRGPRARLGGARRRAAALDRPLSGHRRRQLDPDPGARALPRPALADVPETLPAAVRVCERLPERAAALSALHFPAEAPEAREGLRRLAFEELWELQLRLLRHRRLREQVRGRPCSGRPARSCRSGSRARFRFELTGDQRAAIAAIDEDLAREPRCSGC